jgi:hypothetical protein
VVFIRRMDVACFLCSVATGRHSARATGASRLKTIVLGFAHNCGLTWRFWGEFAVGDEETEWGGGVWMEFRE